MRRLSALRTPQGRVEKAVWIAQRDQLSVATVFGCHRRMRLDLL